MPFFLGGLVKGAARKVASKIKSTGAKYGNAVRKVGSAVKNLTARIRAKASWSGRDDDDEPISEKEAKQRKEHLLYGVTNPIWDDLPRHVNEQGELVIDNKLINQRLFDEYGVDTMDELYKAVEKDLGISFDDMLKSDHEEFYERVIDKGLEVFTARRIRADAKSKLDALLRV